MNKTKLKRKQKIRQKIIQKKAKGPSFIEKNVLISQLESPDDITRSILKQFAASTIQDASISNPKKDLFETLMIRGIRRYNKVPKENIHFIDELWTNLDPLNKFTAKWLTKASNVLIISDFDFRTKNFWWKIMEKMLQQISEIEEGEVPYENIYYQESKDAIIKILKNNGFNIHSTDNWAEVMLGMWRTKNNNDVP